MEIKWENTHKLLQTRPQEYMGIKTGVTTTAGPCLSSLVAVEDRQFIIIVLACAKIGLRFKETEILKRWLFKHEGLNKRMKKMSSLKP
jgi:D-alanyl-D-alanine carboxypeptidase